MKILFADDHQLILDGLQSVITHHFTNSLVDSAINKVELFKKLIEQTFDVLILDVKFGKDNANDFIDEVKKKHPGLKILMLSSVSNSVAIQQILKKADGYVLKSESISEICRGIEEVCDGKQFLSEEVKKKVKFHQNNEIILTRREKEVLAVLMEEKSTKEIADVLFISQKTVEMHRANLFIKLNVINVTGLVKQVIALDLLGE